MGDNSHTGMLQLPECGAQTHKVGKGSREETWEGGAGKSGHRKGHEKHKGFHIAIGLGEGELHPSRPSKKREEKNKNKKPKHRVKLREQ